MSAEHQAGLGVCRATQHFDDGTSKHKEMLIFHCFTACYVFNKEEALAFFRKNPCNPLRNERQNEIKSAVILSYLCNQRAIGPFITHCQHKNSLHPSRRMAWKIFRHGVAVFFPSGCRSQTPYRTKRHEYKKILQISENNSVFILL